ncbi:MAG: nucleoside triphosphate pyrophosphohydrolase [Oscillospiraceae bacterium]|nr:nucleoside triphosphate pyrophosphohydrolase [Oscillospiraceae bacterium]
MEFLRKTKYSMDDLLQIMRILRAPNGCPWDKEQTHESIRKNFIEETYEVAEAIDNKDAGLLKEELGDVLLQVVFHAQIEDELGVFSFSDVADGVCRKLIERHPHIFGKTKADTTQEVLRNWEDIKQKQKGVKNHSEVLLNVPRTLPSLMRCEKIQQRAAKAGFDYHEVDGAYSDMKSEVAELWQAIQNGCASEVGEELGDLLFSVVNVARFVKVDAENALENACDKFIRRFSKVEETAKKRGIDMQSAGIESLDILWKEVKNKEQ